MTAKLSDLLAAGPASSKRFGCLVCDWLAEQSQEDRDAIDVALSSNQWSVQALYRVLRDQGLRTSDNTFRGHLDKQHKTSPNQ